jgi:hypothetical protein
MKTFLTWWNVCVGSMDACTGILLMFFPAVTLRLMGLTALSAEAQVFLSWMGAFVFSVGVSYFLALGSQAQRSGETIWKSTALVRTVIACYVTTQVIRGTLEPLWLTVAATDGIVALGQWYGIRKQWWRA